MRYYDVHTHSDKRNPSGYPIINKSDDFQQLPDHTLFSIGLHPWHINEKNVEEKWLSLLDCCSRENVLALGECGLDKVCETEWVLQGIWFIKQVQLANKIDKPLIIHCVRAFDETLRILKDYDVSVPVAFHGYNKSKELARRILSEGYFLSFGRHLIDNSDVQEVFNETPLDKLFLETDAAEINIEEVYEAAASIRKMEKRDLCREIEKNIVKVFGEKLVTVS